jgi:hypothetical protein
MLAADLIARVQTSRPRHGRRVDAIGPEIARAAVLLVVLAAIACSSLPPQDDLAAEIGRHYADNASEEDGRCPSAAIATVTERKVPASGAESTTLRVRDSYFDESARAATDWATVLRAERACTGFAERDFTLVRGPLGYEVVEMSGPAREEP